MKKKKHVLPLFKPSIIKILLSIFFVYIQIVTVPFGEIILQYSLVPNLIFLPISILYMMFDFMIFNFLALILIIPYCYLISCLLVYLFNIVKQKKWLLIIVIILLSILLGFDEPIINGTINKPNSNCKMNEDCLIKPVTYDICGERKCVNKDWDYYTSMINNVWAIPRCNIPIAYCTCEQDICVFHDSSEFASIVECNNVDDFAKEICIKQVSQRINNISK